MSNKDFFLQRPSPNPTTYAYELVVVVTHKGWLKLGIKKKRGYNLISIEQTDIKQPSFNTG